MPAITLLKHHCEVLHLTTEYDYRLRVLEQAGTYHYPLDAAAEQFMQNSFKKLAHVESMPGQPPPLLIEGRQIKAINYTDRLAWFDFQALCHADYFGGRADY
jgi:cell division protein ZapE